MKLSNDIKHLCEQPQYAALAAERNDLGAALGKVNGRIAEIESLLRTSTTPEDRDSSHVFAALHFARTGEVRALHAAPTALQDEHVALRQQRDALEMAMAARTEAMDRLAGELSHQVTKQCEPQHRELAARYVKLLEQLDAMYEEEDVLIRAIESRGYTARFNERILWMHVGRLAWRSESVLFGHLKEMKRYADVAQ